MFLSPFQRAAFVLLTNDAHRDGGNRGATMYEQLYEDNRRLLKYVAQRYWKACERDRAVSLEDLEQSGFFGLVKAAQTFDPDDKYTWAYWAARGIIREIYKALGYRDNTTTRRKAHTGAISLDAPLSTDDPDGLTGLDLIEDRGPGIDEGADLADLQRVVREAVADLKNERQRDLIQACALDGKPYKEAAEALGVSCARVGQIIHDGQRQLAKDKRIQALIDIELRVPYYNRRTLSQFRRTQTSATEAAALWHMEQLDRLNGRDLGSTISATTGGLDGGDDQQPDGEQE